MMHSSLSRSRVGAAALLLSLCLNVLLVVYIGAQWFDRIGLPAAAGTPRLIEMVARRLPAADADVLWRVYRGREAELSSAQTDYRRALAAAAIQLSRAQLDSEASRRSTLEARDKRVRVGDLVIEVVLEALPQMSSEGRAGLVGSLRRQ